MKQGRSIVDLSRELERIQGSAKDFIVPVQDMKVNSVLDVDVNGTGVFQPTNWAHSQMSSYTGIPKGYYDRIKEQNPSLLSMNINHGFQNAINQTLAKRNGKHETRMIRTIDGNVRAFLSDRYRRLDSYDLLETVFPILQDGRFKVVSAELTERKLYLKAVTDKVQGEIKKGHVVNYGIAISTSDVGCGSAQINPFLNECVCDNGMIMEQAFRKFHIGKSQSSDSVEELLSDETKELSDKAFWAQVKDVIEGTMKEEIFEQNLNKLRLSSELPIKNFDLPKVVELTMRETGITGDKTKDNIVGYLANGADGRGLNKWSLANAFTWAAQAEDADYEDATGLERAGGKIIEMPRNKWESLAA